MRSSVRWVFALAALLSVFTALLPFGGCTSSGTGGDLVPIEFGFSAAATDGVGDTVYDPSWTVELTEARVVVGATYIFPSDPLSASRVAPPNPLRHLLGRAYAHAGDDNEFGASALAEYREQVVVDALSEEVQWFGPVLAESGRADRVTIWIDAPRGQLAGAQGPTRGYHGWVAGTARRGDREVSFESGITLDETPLSQRVDGVPVAGDADLREGHRVVISAHPDQWLAQVDFDSLLSDGLFESDDDGIVRPGQSHPFRSAWLLNFHDPDAFSVNAIERGLQ